MAAATQILPSDRSTQSAEHKQPSQRLKFSYRSRWSGGCNGKYEEEEAVAKPAQKLTLAVQKQLVLECAEPAKQESCQPIGQAQAEQLGRS